MLSFSIIINTDGRRHFLERTLRSLFFLDYPDFEVCVVHGPTDDGTVELLAGQPRIKVATCPTRNLSRSRNIGIAMSAGDVVAFIDDDSIPEPEWLRDLARSYEDPEVAAAGGLVYDHTGTAFQARYVTTNRLAYPTKAWPGPVEHLNFPWSLDTPHLLGTNCSFRRAVLLSIGGFDEEYEYFLDETDVCCRLNDAGHRIEQRPDAYVHHKFAPSHLREAGGIVKTWYPLIKNRVYFALTNGRFHHAEREAIEAGLRDAASWQRTIRAGIQRGIYDRDDLGRFRTEMDAAILDGTTRGLHQQPRMLTGDTLKAFAAPFKRYWMDHDPPDRRMVCLVSQDYPPGENGGIGRVMSQLARSLARAGHHVHVLTRARGPETVDVEGDVWVHRIDIRQHPLPSSLPFDTVPQSIWDYSRTMLGAVKAIDRRRAVDAVFCPLWDCEPLAFVVDGTLPLICALQTTMKFWLESRPERAQDLPWMAAVGDPIMAMEAFIIDKAPLLQANSRAIVRDIVARYGLSVPAGRVFYAPHGMEDWTPIDDRKPVQRDGTVRLLFVGRLESRKGIDVLLRCIPDLLRRHPHAVLDIVGDDTIPGPGGPTYRESFETVPMDASVRSRIVFHGRVTDARLRSFYAMCDVFVAPSRYESFGLVFLEAMVFGKPVVACNAGGAPEVVTHGVTGLLVEPGDPAELAAALDRLVLDGDLRSDMGRAGRADFLRRFTDAAMRDDFLAMVTAVQANLSGRRAALAAGGTAEVPSHGPLG